MLDHDNVFSIELDTNRSYLYRPRVEVDKFGARQFDASKNSCDLWHFPPYIVAVDPILAITVVVIEILVENYPVLIFPRIPTSQYLDDLEGGLSFCL